MALVCRNKNFPLSNNDFATVPTVMIKGLETLDRFIFACQTVENLPELINKLPIKDNKIDIDTKTNQAYIVIIKIFPMMF